MARHITQTLTLTKKLSLSSRFVFPKPFSTKPQLIEVDLGSTTTTTTSSGDGEVIGLNRLEDAIHGIVVRQLAPDWLPFRPGSSYWVPSKGDAANIFGILENSTNYLKEEDHLLVSSPSGWPCPFYEEIPDHHIPGEVEVQSSPTDTLSGDEE